MEHRDRRFLVLALLEDYSVTLVLITYHVATLFEDPHKYDYSNFMSLILFL